MDERGVNIDIVFRNGLKDYEVLPPPDVWDNIRPIIREKQIPYIILRSVAIIAVTLSLSFLAYRWSRETSPVQDEIMQAHNTESVIPSSSTDAVSLSDRENKVNTILLSDASNQVYKPDIIRSSDDDFIVQSIENLSLSNGLQANNTALKEKPELLKISKPVISSMKINRNDLYPVQEIVEQNNPERWSITALLFPSYHNRISKGNNEAMAEIMTSEKPLISYSGGVALSYRINRRFSIQSGLSYSTIGQELSGISAYSGFLNYGSAKGGDNFSVITANGTVRTSNSDVFLLDNFKGDRVITQYTSNVIDPVKSELNYVGSSLRQNFSYLELPVVIRYKVVDKTLDFNIIGGVSSNLLVNNSVSAGNGDKYQIGETEGLNSITFSSSLGLGMEYNLSGKLSMNFEPTFRYYMNPFGSIPGLKIHPFSFGVFSGLSYKF